MAIERITFHPPFKLDTTGDVEDQVTLAIAARMDSADKVTLPYTDLTPEEARGEKDIGLYVLQGLGQIVEQTLSDQGDSITTTKINIPKDSAVVPIIGRRSGRTLMYSVVYYNPHDEDLV